MIESPPPPECAGTYAEGEVDCDGIYRKEKACAWRPTCKRLRDFCKLNDHDLDELVRKRTKADLERLGNAINDLGQLRGTIDEVIGKERRAKPIRAKRFSERMWRLHRHFENQLADRFGEKRIRNSLHKEELDRVVMRQGAFFPIDRTERSGYVAWYCKTHQCYDIALAAVYFRPQLNSVDVHLPISMELLDKHFSSMTLNKLNLFKEEDGQFKTLCRGLKNEEIGIAVGALKRVSERGDYPIPELE